MTRYDLAELNKEEIVDNRYYVAKDDVDTLLNNIEFNIGGCVDHLENITSIYDLDVIGSVASELKKLRDALY